MYEKKSKVSTCVFKKQVVENLHGHEINIFDEYLFHFHGVWECFVSAEGEYESWEDND